MKVNTFGRLALTAGIVAVAASGLVATPAFADPATLYANNLVGFGSDTTQDVMQELSTVIGVDKLASFNSTYTSPATNAVQARPGGPSTVVRAKGSGDGWKMLQVAEGSQVSQTPSVLPSGSATANKANTVGQIDFARASSTQGTAKANGEYVDIPFAIDVVGIAVDPSDPVSKIPLQIGAANDAATVPSIQSIYHCAAKYVYLDASNNYAGVGATSDYSGAAGATQAFQITPLLPAIGSGTSKFFVEALFGSGADAASLVTNNPCIRRTMNNGDPIQEHDGSSVAETANAIGIYSIGQWVAQTKSATTGVTDKTNGTVLRPLALDANSSAIDPTTGSGATLAPNAAAWHAALKRYVYNIVSYRKAVDPTSPIRAMFVGTSSLVCSQPNSIIKMGFAVMPGTDAGDPTSNPAACGSINSTYRRSAFNDDNGGAAMTTAASVTNVADVAAATTAVGRSFIVSVNGGVATHDMGGTVQILDAAYGTPGARVLGSATIGEGTNVLANVTVTPVATGTTKLYAVFIPKLGGIRVTPMSVTSGSDASFASITPTNATTTKLSIRKPSSVGGTVRVVAWVDAGGAFDGGSVTLYSGTVSGAVLATDTLDAGETGAVLNYTQSVASQTIVAKFTPTNSSAVTSTSTPATVVLNKSTPTIAFGTLPAAPNGFVASGNNYAISKTLPLGVKTATVDAATDLVTVTGHALTAGTVVYFSGTTLPGGITSATTKYFVLASGLTANAFKVSATAGGSAVNITTAGTAVKVSPTVSVATASTGNTAGVITLPAHGLAVNDVVFFSGATAPTGITFGTAYFVKAVGTTNTFTVSDTQGGALKTFTAAGSAVTVTKRNALPKVAITVTAPSGVSLKPSGAVKVYIGTTTSDTTHEITTATGLTLSNGAATVTLNAADLWTWVSATNAGATAYVIVKYEGDDAFNGAANVNKTLTVTP